MPDWFTPAVIILGLLALALFVAYWTTRKRKYAVAVVAALALLAAAWLIAHFIPTDRKAIEGSLNEIMAGIRSRNTDSVFANLAGTFRYRTLDKANFRKRVQAHIDAGDAADVEIWGFEVDGTSADGKTTDIHFNVRSVAALGDSRQFFLCRAKFVRESDGKWRMQTFDLYNPFVETNRALDIPGIN
jgi:hypothetical protein